MPREAPLLSLKGVGKRYGGVTALDSVDFSCRRGSIHAILGENGAGKSTLIKTISGAVRPTEGVIEVDGRPVAYASPRDADRDGIVCVFQELSLVPVRAVVILGFVLSGALNAISGLLLTGYSAKAYPGMGDALLLPAIGAVVLGGTSILGGRGTYAGTVLGTILIVLLQSLLTVVQIPEAGRQIIYGVVILAMLVVHGRQGRR